MAAAPIFPKGWMVFPVRAGMKEPCFSSWQEKATDDPDQIGEWHIQYGPDCNWAVAVGKSGLGVLDIDPPTGEDSLFQFELEHEQLPETREHRSARGGRHLIFSDPESKLSITASKIAPKLDTRGGANGKESYILIPPSMFEGRPYAVVRDIPLAPIPASIVKAAGGSHDRVTAAPGIELDQPHNVVRAIDLAKRAAPAIEGHGGDAATYALAAEIMNLGLTSEVTFDVMMEYFNPRCDPPWEPDELRLKIENAARYAQNEPGAYAVAPVSQRLPAATLRKLIAESYTDELPSQVTIEEDRHEWHFDTFNAAEDANLPPITYHDENKLWPRVPGGSLTQIIAQAKGYKTTFYLSELFRLVAKELKAAGE
jgi:hypothetical protein